MDHLQRARDMLEERADYEVEEVIAFATVALAEQQKRTADALERIVAIVEASTREGELYIHTHAR